MQPSPMAETCRPLSPNFLVCILFPWLRREALVQLLGREKRRQLIRNPDVIEIREWEMSVTSHSDFGQMHHCDITTPTVHSIKIHTIRGPSRAGLAKLP